MKIGYKNYMKVKAETALPLEQVAIMLERASQHLFAAHKAFLDNDIEARFDGIDKAYALITGLLGTLSSNPSPDSLKIVQTMDAFYHDCLLKLVQVTRFQKIDLCLELARALQEMAVIWRDVGKDAVDPYSPAPQVSSYTAQPTKESSAAHYLA